MAAEPLRPSEKFEQQISRIHELIEQPGSEVTWNDHVRDPDNPVQTRQIDFTIKRDGKLTVIVINDKEIITGSVHGATP